MTSFFKPLFVCEVKRIWRRSGTVFFFGIFTVLMVVAAILNGVRQESERAQQRGFQELVREQWMSQPDRNPHRVAHYGTFAFKPRDPLAGFDPGLASYGGRVQFLEAHKQNAANFADAGTLSATFRLGELSPSFLVELILPLVVLVLGHGLFAGEVESGRMNLLRAQLGDRVSDLWLGKVGGLFLAVLPFLWVSVMTLFWVLGGYGWQELLRAGILVGCMIGYCGFWVLVVSLASVYCKSSQQALVLCVGLWFFSCVLVPRLAAGGAAIYYPLPNKSEFEAGLAQELEKLGDSHNPNDPVFAALKKDTLRKYGAEKVEDLPFNFKATVMTEGEKNSAKVYDLELGKVEQIQARQAAFLRRVGWFSPALVWRDLSTRLCGTDLGAQQRFTRDAEHYRYHFIQELNGLQHAHTDYEGKRAVRISSEFFDKIEDFNPRGYSLSVALEDSESSWVTFGLWSAVALFVGRKKAR